MVEDFRVTNNGADILLEWDMLSLAGVTEFQLFRRVNSEPTKSHVTTLSPNGQMKYSYLDDDIFKTEGLVVHYELHIKVNGKVEIITRSLSHNPTSIQRTWGSIKSMFRY
ncbi:MAG: hypothetical protein AAF399_20695 [Bacteroidota bacterium]